MNSTDHLLLAFLCGVLAGAVIVAWVIHHANLHERIQTLEHSLHDRLQRMEDVFTKKAPAVPPAPAEAAAAAAQPVTDVGVH